MSTKHRVATAVKKAEKQLMISYGEPTMGVTKYFHGDEHLNIVVVDDFSAQVWREMLMQVFRSQRHQVIHNGRKPQTRKY